MSLPTKIMQQFAGVGRMLFGNAAGGLIYSTLLESPERMGYYIRRGVVKHSTPGFYGYVVKLDDGTLVSCVPPDSGPGTLYGLGATDGSVITPGIEVLVSQSSIGSSVGTILCVCDNQTYSGSGKYRVSKGDESAGAFSRGKAPYSGDPVKKIGTPNVGMYKISDSYTGDWAMFNEFGAGYFLGRSRATIRGSDLSRIDLFPINDQVRVSAGYFQMYTHGGLHSVFAYDNGYVNEEKLFSPYVWETAGCFSSDELDKKLEIPNDTNKPLDAIENPDFARYREYCGAVAGGKQIFTSCPDKNNKSNIGLSHVALSDSGAVVIRSTSDIILSRTSKIDVPVRIRNPESRGSGSEIDIAKKDETPVVSDDNQWWLHDTGRRTASNTVLQQYSRFKKNPEDWRIDEAKAAPETYDNHSGSVGDRANDASSIVLGQDGSIVLSTSEGAEIRLQGKNITISCPGKIFFKSGEDVVTLAKKNIFEKSGGNFEMTAKGNMLMSSEGRVSTFADKSVFTEVGRREGSNTPPEMFYGDNGSSTPGVYFSTNGDGGFVVDSKHVVVHPRSYMEVTSVDTTTGETPKNSALFLGIGRVSLNSFDYKNTVGDSEEVSSGLVLSPSSSLLFGRSSQLLGGSSVYVGSSSEIAQMIPTQGDDTMYADICENFRYSRSLALYEIPAFLDPMPHFSYTNYDFDSPVFEESSWVNLANPDLVETWGEEMEVNGTLPWPGKGAKIETYRQNQSMWKKTDTDFGDKEAQEREVKNSLSHKLVEFKDFKG